MTFVCKKSLYETYFLHYKCNELKTFFILVANEYELVIGPSITLNGVEERQGYDLLFAYEQKTVRFRTPTYSKPQHNN